jgi:hypothetical protein
VALGYYLAGIRVGEKVLEFSFIEFTVGTHASTSPSFGF